MKLPTWLIGLACLFFLAVVWRRNAANVLGDGPSANSETRAAFSSVAPEIASVNDAVYIGGRWYVTDTEAKRVHVLDSTGSVVRSIGRFGRGPGEFLSPSAIAATASRVYVAQVNVPDVSVFDANGKFLHLLHAERPCGASGILTLATGGDELFVLRRCMEMPRGFRLQVERAQGNRLAVWPAVADTVHSGKPGLAPLTVPILAANADRVLFAAGHTPCLRVFRRADGIEEEPRCLLEIPRVAVSPAERARLEKTLRNRVEIPDSMPRIRRALLIDGRLLVQAINGSDSMTWIELPWKPAPGNAGRVLGRPHTRESFMSGISQLIVSDDVEGVRLETVRITR